MGLSLIDCSLILVVCFPLLINLTASTSISDSVFDSRISSQRKLLQIKKPCPVSFEFQNYTIVTSKCKGPQYLPNLCCPALKDFACPFADYLNDKSTDCAETMFSYITPHGNYPPGLFSRECREGKEGLACPPSSSPSSSQSRKLESFLPMLMVTLVLSLL